MSGSNPFRRSKLPAADSPNVSTSTPRAVDDDSIHVTPSKGTKKKRVQILSPPHSPEDEGRRLSATEAAGPAESLQPPTSTFYGDGDDDDDDGEEEESDSTATATFELGEALRNSRIAHSSLSASDTKSTSGMRAPYNPFARTMATSGTEHIGLQKEQQEGDARASGGRPALDVDTFKNILLTGSAVPSPPTGKADSRSGPSRQQNSSSSTDNSFIFDPTHSIQTESPRSSFDEYAADPSETDNEDPNESSNLMGEGRLDDFAPPAPPKPKSRGPQTVSFADFDQSIPPDFQSSGRPLAPVNQHITGILRPTLSRSSSDLNKPLPLPPKNTADPSPPVVPEKDRPSFQQPAAPSNQAIEQEPAKKAPPPPPTSRRKAGEAGRPRSTSNQSDNSLESTQLEATSSEARSMEANSKPSAPRPPPARKVQSTAQPSVPSSQASSQTTSPNHSTDSIPKAVPPPPPRRYQTRLGRSANSSPAPSEASRQDLTPGEAFLSSLTSNAAPPAPPPRRVGGSKRSSVDGPPGTLARKLSNERYMKASGNSFENERSSSISSLQRVPEPGEDSEQAAASPSTADSQRDILADMSAFQAEIDALRQNAQRPR